MTAGPADGNWGRWGSEDERGGLNFITPEAVLRAVTACRTGRIYHLGLPIQKQGLAAAGARDAPQRLTVRNFGGQPSYAAGLGATAGVGANEDVVVMNTHTLTHMDALSHVYAGNLMYNGFEASTFETNAGATRLGIETVEGIAGRALLFDVAAHRGVDWLTEDTARISGQDLESCAAWEGISPRSGDILLVRTGHLDRLRAGAQEVVGQPGIDLSAVDYIRDHEFAAVGSDNGAIEMIPFDDGRYLSVHIELLVNLGLPLLENLDLHGLAADRVYESLLVVAPLLITGGSGSPVNPIAIG